MQNGDFLRGLIAPYTSAGFLLMRPRLWHYAALPVVVGAALAALIVWVMSRWFWHPGWLPLLGVVGDVLLFLLLVVVGIVLYVVLSSVVSAPFYDAMCVRVEAELLEKHPELIAPPVTFRVGFVHSLWEACRRLMLAVPFFLLSILLGLIPLFGPLISGVYTAILGGVFLTLDALSYPLDRRRVPLFGKLAYARRHSGATVGLGTGLALLFAIPGAFLFAPLLSSLAGTRTYCETALKE